MGLKDFLKFQNYYSPEKNRDLRPASIGVKQYL
jgi:hypothetical protein